MNAGPRWKRHQWTVARVAALLAAVMESKNGKAQDLASVKKRFGIGLREMIHLNQRFGLNEDLSGGTQLKLELQFEEGKIHAVGAERLSQLTRLSKVQAAFAAQALENLAVQGATKAFSQALSKRLHTAAGRVDDQLLIYRPWDPAPLRDKVAILHGAMKVQHTVAFEYRGPSSKSAGRVADPLSLRRDQGVWRALCWDHQRKAMRTFKLEHLTKLVVTNQAFEWPKGLKEELIKAKDLSVYEPTGKEVTVKLRVSGKVAAEWKAIFKKVGKRDKAGTVEVTVMVGSVEWLIRTFLPWADEVRVLEPAAFLEQWNTTISCLSGATK